MMGGIKGKLQIFLDRIENRINHKIKKRIDELKVLQGKEIVNQWKLSGKKFENLHDYEFSVFSQFGDDGIIQYLINKIGIKTEVFVEFGVEDYTESNTRFLLINNNWSGLVIDSSERYIERIKRDSIYWRHNLTAICQFVTKDNIDSILKENGFSGQVGILHIDVDGNDYWVWKSIKEVNPELVIMEYNSVFGKDLSVTIPYNPNFQRHRVHYSNLYWGCSLKALVLLAASKGYAFIGCNSNGNNAYFVRKDKLSRIKAVSIEKGYIESKFRESQNAQGRPSFLSGKERLMEIRDLKIFDIEQNKNIKIKDLIKKKFK